MWKRLRPLFEPLNFAAYLAWAGTGSELLQRPEIRAAYLEGGRRG